MTTREINHGNLVELLKKNRYRNIVFYSHGKDDHLNLGEYTICGRYQIFRDKKYNKAPSCSNGGSCFKKDDLLIKVNEIQAETIIMASCFSATFADANNYESDFNLAMCGVDGISKRIIGANSVTHFGIKEAPRHLQ